MFSKKGYMFTNKNHSRKGIMSTILGIMAIITLSIAVYFSYLQQGHVSDRLGAACLLAVIFMIAGAVAGVWSTTEKDKFKMFSIVGIVVNLVAFGLLSLILYAGAYVN